MISWTQIYEYIECDTDQENYVDSSQEEDFENVVIEEIGNGENNYNPGLVRQLYDTDEQVGEKSVNEAAFEGDENGNGWWE